MNKMRMAFFLAAVWLISAVIGEPGAQDADPASDPVVKAVQKVLPSVVNISTERLMERAYSDPFEDIWREFFGHPRAPRREGAQSLGSGVIVDEEGWVITNWHVVRRAGRIKVTMTDGTEREARYVSGDENNDLALLKIVTQNRLPSVDLALDREPYLGETVVAVGNPFGLEHTVTKGVISAKNRRYGVGSVEFNDILQTDAAINPGNSGGPLINTRGELVGINMAILSQAQGIGFAIPVSRVAGLLATWFSPERRARLWFGARLSWNGDRITVSDVQSGSPAAKAGMQTGDVVRKVDGMQYREVLRLLRYLAQRKTEDPILMELERDGKPLTIKVTMKPLPQMSAAELMKEKFGLDVQEMTAELARAMGYPFAQGVLVAGVEEKSPAARVGMRRGIIITHVAGREIETLDVLADQLADIRSGDPVSMAVFIVERRGGMLLQQTSSVTMVAR